MKCSCHSHAGFLTARGYAESAQRELKLNGIAGMGLIPDEVADRLDKSGSVSALIEVEDAYVHVTDQLLLEQSERFLHGT